MFLRGFCAVGKLGHEVQLPNGRRPDIEFPLSVPGRDVVLVGDVTTVSDTGLDERNPVDFLGDEIERLAKKYHLDPRHFRFQVEGNRVGKYHKARIELALPGRHRLGTILRKDFEPFVRDVRKNPRTPRDFKQSDGEAMFNVMYDPTSRLGGGGGYLSYDIAVSLTNNPVFAALRLKADQLRDAPEGAIRLIVLCDAGCATMSRSGSSSVFGYDASAIAREFLRQHSSISVVLLVTVTGSALIGRRDYRVKLDLIAQRRIDQSVLCSVQATLADVVATLPTPVRNCASAARWSLEKGYGIGMAGGYKAGHTIKISSRALLDLLAGRTTSKEFRERHGWGEPPAVGAGHDLDFFNRALKAGRMIRSIKVESAGDQDDDWLEFEFGDQDAAITPFHVP